MTLAGRVDAETYWERITYFLERVVPVAEEYKVRLASHSPGSGGYLNFRETFIDNGSVDMVKAMRVYQEVGYDGMMMPDHVPRIEGVDSQQGFAFAFGYITALIAAVSAEA
jgi:D-mannonate dehydratase